MRQFFSSLLKLFVSILFFSSAYASADNTTSVPVLVYHNFDPIKKGIMTLSTHRFEEQMQWLQDNHYHVIPMQELVNYLQGKTNALPSKSVVITDDDGRKSVYTYMLPIVKKFNIPVTLFIYTSVISKEPYALTWEQLKALQQTGLFTIESHTIWHPNFKQEKKHYSEKSYEAMVTKQLAGSKKILDEKLGIHVTLLAWPFGIFDHYVMQQASKVGYTYAFSIKARNAARNEDKMAMPRYMIVQDQSMKMFEAIVKGHAQGKRKTS